MGAMFNKGQIVVGHTQETVQFGYILRSRPMLDNLYFAGIRGNTSAADNMPQILDTAASKCALAPLYIQLVFPQRAEDLPQMVFVFLGRAGENENIVEIYGTKPIQTMSQDVIH